MGFPKALLLLKMIAEVIDPVMSSPQAGCAERQFRTIQTANICGMKFFLFMDPSLGRFETGPLCRASETY